MVKASCGCLNVRIHIRGELNNSLLFPTDDLKFEESQDVFFQQVTLNDSSLNYIFKIFDYLLCILF
jgi:hypothetical protein